MSNTQVNLNLRQPTPNVVSGNVNNDIETSQTSNTERKINYPEVGVVTIPNISKTPLADTLALKKQETPKMAYKLTTKKNNGFTLQNFFSLSIIGCALVALFGGLKK